MKRIKKEEDEEGNKNENKKTKYFNDTHEVVKNVKILK